MKNHLVAVINEIIYLLKECDLIEHAEWFAERLRIIKACDEESEIFIQQLKEIKKVIAGMGSFTDLPLTPRKNSEFTEKEVTIKQFELAKQLDDLIQAFLRASSGDSGLDPIK